MPRIIPADIRRTAFLILATTTGLSMLPHDMEVLKAKIGEALLDERERAIAAVSSAFKALEAQIRYDRL